MVSMRGMMAPIIQTNLLDLTHKKRTGWLWCSTFWHFLFFFSLGLIPMSLWIKWWSERLTSNINISYSVQLLKAVSGPNFFLPLKAPLSGYIQCWYTGTGIHFFFFSLSFLPPSLPNIPELLWLFNKGKVCRVGVDRKRGTGEGCNVKWEKWQSQASSFHFT